MMSFLSRLPVLAARPAANRLGLAAQRCRNAQVASTAGSPLRMSPAMIQKTTRNVLENIDLIVYDMAGTVVQEGGVVYVTLRQVMVEDGMTVSESDMHPWHGAKKEAVIEHFARKSGTKDHEMEARISRLSDNFLKSINDAYFADVSPISHIEVGLLGYFRQLQSVGIKVALDTGYPPDIQNGLVKKMGFDTVVDGWISSYDVKDGRPYPYMIHRLMERLHIENVKRVAKVGDSVRDIEEGRNAGCGLVVGVLSGADSAENLMAAGADIIADVATDLPVPRKRGYSKVKRIPDLS